MNRKRKMRKRERERTSKIRKGKEKGEIGVNKGNVKIRDRK